MFKVLAMKACLILILLSVVVGESVGAATPDRKAVENLMATYLRQATLGEKGNLKMDPGLADRWDEDVEELSACKSTRCSVRLRSPVAVTGDEEQDLFEIQLDVVHGADVIARRSGCYVVQKDDGQWQIRDYKYECSE